MPFHCILGLLKRWGAAVARTTIPNLRIFIFPTESSRKLFLLFPLGNRNRARSLHIALGSFAAHFQFCAVATVDVHSAPRFFGPACAWSFFSFRFYLILPRHRKDFILLGRQFFHVTLSLRSLFCALSENRLCRSECEKITSGYPRLPICRIHTFRCD